MRKIEGGGGGGAEGRIWDGWKKRAWVTRLPLGDVPDGTSRLTSGMESRFSVASARAQGPPASASRTPGPSTASTTSPYASSMSRTWGEGRCQVLRSDGPGQGQGGRL